MKARLAIAIPILLVGCGSPDKPATLLLTYSTPFNGATYQCTNGGIGVDRYSPARAFGLIILCGEETVDESDGGTRSSSAQLEVAYYHGLDTYAFQCDGGYGATTCPNSNGNAAWFPLDDYDLVAWPASPGFLPASCKVTVSGPSTLVTGDHVSGSFDCDPIQAVFVRASTATSHRQNWSPQSLVSSRERSFRSRPKPGKHSKRTVVQRARRRKRDMPAVTGRGSCPSAETTKLDEATLIEIGGHWPDCCG